MQEQEYCEHCGAKLVKTRVVITKSLANTLIKLRRLESELGKKQIWLDHDDVGNRNRLTRTQRNNMTRLRWLGLARYTESHSGRWFIASKGYAFLRGEPVKCEIWTFRNKIVEELRTDKTMTLAQVYKYGDVPFYDPITDRASATPNEQAKAVEQRTGLSTIQVCAYAPCTTKHTINISFGVKPAVWYCSPEHRKLGSGR